MYFPIKTLSFTTWKQHIFSGCSMAYQLDYILGVLCTPRFIYKQHLPCTLLLPLPPPRSYLWIQHSCFKSGFYNSSTDHTQSITNYKYARTNSANITFCVLLAFLAPMTVFITSQDKRAGAENVPKGCAEHRKYHLPP